jgi:hypothetical protein
MRGFFLAYWRHGIRRNGLRTLYGPCDVRQAAAMATIHAPDEFRCFKIGEHASGVLRWGRGVKGDLPLREGDELEPHETVGGIEFGEVDLAIGVDSFGRVAKLLVHDGATVAPGQALFEYEEREPTMEEWQAENDRAASAERRAREADEELDSPFGPLRAVFKRRMP